MIRFVKFTIAVISLPVIWGTLRAFIKTISIIDTTSPEHIYFVAGLLTYPVFQILFSRPLRTYVFGHELTHALASLLMGGKVRRFKVSKKGGSVSLSKTNFVVSLSPYVVPVYTVILLAVYFTISFFIPLNAYHRIFLFLVGFSLSFHCALTVFAIKQRQPDISQTGIFFSLVIIILVSPWILVLILKAVFLSQINLTDDVQMTYHFSKEVYEIICSSLLKLWEKFV